MTIILLARHGETDWNRDLRWQGQADPPLNARGRGQSRALAEELADVPLAAIYSSDLRRARETAEIVGTRKGMTVEARPELREVDVGSWSELTSAEVEERFPGAFQRWQDVGDPTWEGGETHAEMAERVLSAVVEIAAAHDENVLIVAHGGPIRAILAHALGVEFATRRREIPAVDNCRVSRIAFENGVFRRLD